MLIIIAPYRDRQAQKDIFIPHMKNFLEKKGVAYKIIICEQSDDSRPFNLGAIRNIGFLEASKNSYPGQPIYCFHDIDTIPISDECIYDLQDVNSVYHPYGVRTSLGGILFVTEKAMKESNGYPNNYWGWGLEDVCIMARLQVKGYTIDETNFEWLGDEKLFSKIHATENTRTWPNTDIEIIKALYYDEANNRYKASLNGVENIKYEVLSEEHPEDNVIHIVVRLDMPYDPEATSLKT
jgi:hypothetical protein